MADLIAIGYPDEATAEAAADEARRLAQDLIIQPDAIAVIVRDTDGSYHVHTNHHAVGGGATWGMFWGHVMLRHGQQPIAVATGARQRTGSTDGKTG
jgi:uncharacterized membrane protein